MNDGNILDENYKDAKKIYNILICEKFKDNHEIYLKVYSLLPADVFENFRQTCLDTYKVDPSHYFTTPGLAFDSLLKYTNGKLNYVKYSDMLLFTEKGIRGGISVKTERYTKANNKDYVNFDRKKHIIHNLFRRK